MLLNSANPIPPPVADAIVGAVHALDSLAQVQVDATLQQVWIDGRLTAQQAVAALDKVGCDTQIGDDPFAPHEQGGSTCCGSCS
jgi:hypothetical protein